MKKATREHTKLHNWRLVLRTIYQEGEISRADLARVTHLTKTTVSNIVSDLINEDLVAEVGYGPSIGGKPPMMVALVDDSRHLIGLDLANSEFRGSVLDLRGNILHRVKLPVPNQDGRFMLGLVYELVDSLMVAVKKPLLGIGIGSPGLMDAPSGIIRQAINLNWLDLPLRDLLQERYEVPVYLANDSHAAALGEYSFGPDRGSNNLIVVKAGRGTSAGIVLNGRLHYGERSGAGEIGHVRVLGNDKLCPCGHVGCLETIVSSLTLIEKARGIFASNPQSSLHKFAATAEEINTEKVVLAFQDGDEAIQNVVEEIGFYLGLAVANFVGVFNIQNIILAGSLARFGQPLVDIINREMRCSAMDTLAKETNVYLSNLGEDVVMLGAASLLLSNELGAV